MRKNDFDNEKLFLEIDSLEDSTETIPKSNNKNKLIIILVVIALIALSILYFGDYYYNSFLDETNEKYYNSGLENYLEQEENQKEQFENQKDNITIETSSLTVNKELMAVLVNNNPEVVTDLIIEVIFYDGENKPIEIDSSKVSIIEKNSKCYVKFLNTPESFERYEFLISKEYYWYNNIEYVTENISFEVEPKDEYTNLKITNKYSKKVSEISFQIVYYDYKDKVIDVEDIHIYDIKKNKTENEELYLTVWDNKTYKPIEYKRYEINILGAYIY